MLDLPTDGSYFPSTENKTAAILCIFRAVTSCSVEGIHQRFGGPCCLRLQGRCYQTIWGKISEYWNIHGHWRETVKSPTLQLLVYINSFHRFHIQVSKRWVYGKGRVTTVLNSLSTTPWRYMRDQRYNYIILKLGTRWRWVVSFTHRPLYPSGKYSPVTVVKRAGWAPDPVWTLWRRAKFLSFVRNETPIPGSSSSYPSRYTNHIIPAPKPLSLVSEKDRY
jgi:hypothetical protein